MSRGEEAPRAVRLEQRIGWKQRAIGRDGKAMGVQARQGSHIQDCGWAVVREQSDGTRCPAGQ